MKQIIFLLSCGMMLTQLSCAQSKAVVGEPASASAAQSSTFFNFERFIPGSFSTVEVDVYGNLFVVTATNQLKKLSPAGDSISVFNDVKKYGNPSLIDVSNPLKILLYYKNFATAVFLDRLVSLKGSLNLRTAGIFNAKAVVTSYDNYFWLFDEQDFTLKKIDEQGKILLKSNDLRNQIGETPSATEIIDKENAVYVYDVKKGFFLFDYYGAYKSNISLSGWKNINVSGTILYGFRDEKLCIYDMATAREKQYALPATLGTDSFLKVVNGKLYLLKREGIFVFEIK